MNTQECQENSISQQLELTMQKIIVCLFNGILHDHRMEIKTVYPEEKAMLIRMKQKCTFYCFSDAVHAYILRMCEREIFNGEF